MGNPKDIFKSHNLLTEKEISDYLGGNLSEEQRRKIELKISQDEFNGDGLDGLTSNPNALIAYESARETVLKNIDKKSGGWQFHHTMILALFSVAAMIVIGTKLFPESGNVTAINSVIVPVTNDETQDTVNIALVKELTDSEIEESIELPEIHLVKAKEIIITSPVVLDSSTSDVTSLKMTFDETVELKKVDPIGAPDKIIIPTIDDVVYSNVPVVYSHKFLLVDYSKIYAEAPVISKIEFTGTSADLENKDDKLHEGQTPNAVKTVKIPYKDYLNETQEMFGRNDFKSALKRYKVIINSYPEDLNAHFYSGLCYYNIGKYSLAHKHFTLAQKHAYNTFKIDAQWYDAKTYYMEGKNESCKLVLQRIIENNDYYTSQAKELLKKLK